MKIVFFQRDPLEILPPLISLMRLLKESGHEIYYFGGIDSQAARQILNGLNVTYKLYPYRIVRFADHPFLRIFQKLISRLRPYVLRYWIWHKIEKIERCSADGGIILWAQSMISSAILGKRALKYGKRFVCSLYDLGDEDGRNLYGFDINEFYQNATIVECEYNRAHILMAQKNMQKLPFVLPNKPYSHPRRRNMEITDTRAKSIVESWGDRKVFLYQGALQSDRGDLFKIIEILCKNFPDAIVAAMGKPNETTSKLSAMYSNFSFISRINPPYHLEITSHADVGLASYKGGSFYGLDPANAVYCAPNKIFEYSGFGIPMLSNDIPGLRYSIGLAKAGECLETIDEKSVVCSARKILNTYAEYSANATAFFDSVDLNKIVGDILDFACEKVED